jgi:hypothetical protein
MMTKYQHHVGITASREPPTYAQLITLIDKLSTSKRLAECFSLHQEAWFHHGDCLEGDEIAHNLATILGYKTHVHPPIDDRLRAFMKGDKTELPKPYIERNRDIVGAVSELLVMPNTTYERIRSGTWATWRYAKQRGIRWVIIWPDGTFKRGKGTYSS